MDAPRSPLVLVADDDVRTTRTLLKLLREDGFAAEHVADGAQAVARLSRGPQPDVLVTDLRMPHVDGAVVIRFARSLWPALPVILVTGYPNQVSALERECVPPARVLCKPYAYETLRSAIEEAVRQSTGASRV